LSERIARSELENGVLSRLRTLGLRRYQGAFTGVLRRGIFRGDIVHFDVKSMYPVLMLVLNLSSKNVSLLSRGSYTGRYVFDFERGIVEVPDKYLGQIRVRVGREDSVTRKFMLKFLKLRERLRKGRQTPAKRSHQLAIKLIMQYVWLSWLGV